MTIEKETVTVTYDNEEVTKEELKEKVEGLSDDNVTVSPVGTGNRNGHGADIDQEAQDGHYNYNLDGIAPEQKEARLDWKPESNINPGDEDVFQENGILFGEKADAAEKAAEEARQEEREKATEESRNTTSPDGDKLLEETKKAAELHKNKQADAKNKDVK